MRSKKLRPHKSLQCNKSVYLSICVCLCKWKQVCVCSSTGVRVYTECRHSGVFVHEAVCDPAIGALVSIHSMNLQNESPCWLVLQDWRALSVLLTLRRKRQREGRSGGRERTREDNSNVSTVWRNLDQYSILLKTVRKSVWECYSFWKDRLKIIYWWDKMCYTQNNERMKRK